MGQAVGGVVDAAHTLQELREAGSSSGSEERDWLQVHVASLKQHGMATTTRGILIRSPWLRHPAHVR